MRWFELVKTIGYLTMVIIITFLAVILFINRVGDGAKKQLIIAEQHLEQKTYN